MEIEHTTPHTETLDNTLGDTPVIEDQTDVMHEVKDNDTVGDYVGQCKWFNNSYGYGFITIWDGPEKGTDIFVHHSGITPLNSMYKTLKKGEYVMFDVSSGNKGKQAVNVRGICNGPLLCDHIQIKKTPIVSPVSGLHSTGVNVHPAEGVWNTVPYRKRVPPLHPGAKRQRNGRQVDTST